jgi:uncharacterized protein YjbI with pentapeptide repeats
VPTPPREPLPPRLAADLAATEVAVEDLAEGVEGVRARDLRLAGARLGRLGLLDCAFSRCDLAGLDAAASSLVRVELTGSRLTGLAGTEVLLRDVVLRDCRMDLASLRDARLERVTFERCDLRELDLQGARLHEVRLLGCDLSEAILEDADCTRCELHDCSYTGLRGISGLSGTTIGWPDAIELAPAFAAALGVRVADGGEFATAPRPPDARSG